ncbi:hypothetical protein HY638_00935 [Candidatus Woesearchaeota archaeon]|nr:hypothetical protein [Candidatus Woesearchaeota archaeon]
MTKVYFAERRAIDNYLDPVGVLFRKGDGSIDVEQTNSHRTERALRCLPPVLEADGNKYYRKISREGGLICIGYDTEMPGRLESLADTETIPIEEAMEFLRADKAQMRLFIRQGKIKKKGSNVFLKGVNEVKDEERYIEDKLQG